MSNQPTDRHLKQAKAIWKRVKGSGLRYLVEPEVAVAVISATLADQEAKAADVVVEDEHCCRITPCDGCIQAALEEGYS